MSCVSRKITIWQSVNCVQIAADKIKNVKGWGRKGVEKQDLMHVLNNRENAGNIAF